MTYPWLEISRRLQSIAQAGLTFSENKYDIERFEQIMELSQQILADHTDLKYERIREVFRMEEGYLTPKVDIRAVVLREDKILFVKETTDGKWSLPGGWADVGFTPKEVAEKEVEEESGLLVKAVKLIAVMDKKCHPHPPDVNYVYKIFILCEEAGGELKAGVETSDAAFFDVSQLPELSEPRNTVSQISTVYNMVRSGNFEALVD